MPTIARKPRRILLPSIAVLGVAALVSVIVMALPGSQPSAQAQVAAAVDATSSESYRIHIEAGDRMWEGAFDPGQRVGVITEAGGVSETRFIGDLMYVQKQSKWSVESRDDSVLKGAPASVALVKSIPLDPQVALQQLRSVTDVREDGPASGPGWTGQRFTFSLTNQQWSGAAGAEAKSSAASGAVDVDDQGRVRRLEVTFADDGQSDVMTIGDFGTPVSVTAPPADQVLSKPEGDPDTKPTGDSDGPVSKSARDPAEPLKESTTTNP